MKQAGLFQLNWKDLGKGLIVAVLGAVATIVQTSIADGNLHFNWTAMGKVALITALAYLTKNIFTNNKDEFMTKDVPKP